MTLTKNEKIEYLKILGLPPDASLAEIQQAYRRLRDMYTSEISLFSSILTDFKAEKKEEILKELEEANRKILNHMESEQSLQQQKKPKPSGIKIPHKEKPKEVKFNSQILEEINEKLDLEESKLKQEYIRRIDDLMFKGTALLTLLNEIMKQLQNLESRLPRKNGIQIDISEKLNSLKTKVDDIQKAYSLNKACELEYGWPVIPTEQVGPLSEQMSLLRDSIYQCQGAPTQTQINQFISIERRIVALLTTASEIKEKDIPDLNNTLKELDIPLITISRILHNFMV